MVLLFTRVVRKMPCLHEHLANAATTSSYAAGVVMVKNKELEELSMNSTALGAEKAAKIIFISKAHEDFYYEHLKKVSDGVPREESLWVAACLHDIGKLFTKSRINGKGEEDDYCHYYQHHCVGAYECLTCFDFSGALTGKDIYDAFYTANLIYYHMHPYLSWSQSNKAKNKDKYLIGKQMFSDVMLLHEADVKGH